MGVGLLPDTPERRQASRSRFPGLLPKGKERREAGIPFRTRTTFRTPDSFDPKRRLWRRRNDASPAKQRDRKSDTKPRRSSDVSPNDRRVVFVKPAYSSVDRSKCGERVPKPLSERMKRCPRCGLVVDRDTNAVYNPSTARLHSLASKAAWKSST